MTHWYRDYQRRDVVVFHPPPAFAEVSGRTDLQNEALIKRIVAVAGDIVEIKGGRLYINSQPQEEGYLNEAPEYDLGPLKVPSGTVLVLGDNRNHSLDGHLWGFLPVENVIGRAVVKYWPVWRAGLINTQ